MIPTAASGRLPAPQDTSITVRYRRGSLNDAVTSEAAALPTPITASRKPNMLESPPSWSRTTKGRSTSIGPIRNSTEMQAHSSVQSSHGVRTV